MHRWKVEPLAGGKAPTHPLIPDVLTRLRTAIKENLEEMRLNSVSPFLFVNEELPECVMHPGLAAVMMEVTTA